MLMEYGHIPEIVGKKNLVFTGIKTEKQKKKLEKSGKVIQEKVLTLKLNNKKMPS